MRKVILIALMAVMASAGTVMTTSVSNGNVEATVKVAGQSATVKTKTTSVRQDVGYAWTHVRAVGYVQVDKYKDDLITSTESNAASYGVEVDYTHAINDSWGFFVGGLIGQGSKNLGSEGDSVGISRLTFTDSAIRTGITYNIDSFQLTAGVENKIRDYDDEVVYGYTVELEEEIQTVFIGAGFKF